ERVRARSAQIQLGHRERAAGVSSRQRHWSPAMTPEGASSRPQAEGRLVLLVSPQFPPSTMVGAHRARHLARHLPSHGWIPTVITVDERDYTEAIDHRLNRLVSRLTRIVRVRALPAKLTRLAGVSDIGLRSYAALHREIHDELARKHYDLVFI